MWHRCYFSVWYRMEEKDGTLTIKTFSPNPLQTTHHASIVGHYRGDDMG